MIMRNITATHRPLSSSFLGFPCRILNINHKKELLRGLWVVSVLSLHQEASLEKRAQCIAGSSSRRESGSLSCSGGFGTKRVRSRRFGIQEIRGIYEVAPCLG